VFGGVRKHMFIIQNLSYLSGKPPPTLASVKQCGKNSGVSLRHQ